MGNIDLGKEPESKDKDKDNDKDKDKERPPKTRPQRNCAARIKSSKSPAATRDSSYAVVWSPDSKKLAWSDKDLRLWYVDIDEKKPVEVDHAKYFEITTTPGRLTASGSPTTSNSDTGLSVVYLYSTVDKKITAVTSDLVNSIAATFDPEGNYLYFLSDRDYNEVLGNYDFEFANPKTTRPYLVTLHADAPSPFPALSDETAVKREEPAPEASASDKDKGKDKDKDKAKKEDDKKKSPEKKKEEAKEAEKEANEVAKNFHIDLDGLQNRIVALPVPPASITG